MNYIFSDIKNFKNFKTITKLNSGYSKDEKYHIITYTNDNLLLRISFYLFAKLLNYHLNH